MNHYHIKITLKKLFGKKFDLCKIDQRDKDEVTKQVILPYIKKEKFFFRDKFINSKNIKSLIVKETTMSSNELVESLVKDEPSQSREIARAFKRPQDEVFREGNSVNITASLMEEAVFQIKSATNCTGNNSNLLKSNLHESIKTVALQKYLDGHFADAVESACKEISSTLNKIHKEKKGTEKKESDLFSAVFNDKEENTLLRVADLNLQSGKDEQEGYKFLLMGMWKALRNPKAHANLNLTQDEAYDRLIFISMLMKRIDKAIEFTFGKLEEKK